MSVHFETNKWAPKLIIAFQLTVWSIVGIILLQKGTISLHEKMKARNDTADVQEKFTRWNEKESVTGEVVNVAATQPQTIKVFQTDTRQINVSIDTVDDVTFHGRLPRKIRPSHKIGDTDSETSKKMLMIEKRTTIHHEHDTKGARPIHSSGIHSNDENEAKNINYEEKVIGSLVSNQRSYDTEKATMKNATPRVLFKLKSDTVNLAKANEINSFEHKVDETISYETTENANRERKPHRSPVNRIGAAIAIIMLAIGIVMLLLGPFIVILRAFSNRRRTKEMLHKKRNHSDRPPTYEEATLMDQAPRYSTLQLDTIVESAFSL